MKKRREEGWEPTEHHKDPMVNAILNVAEGMSAISHSIDGLLYALKYSKGEGLSVAEAIEKASTNVAESIAIAADSIAQSIE